MSPKVASPPGTPLEIVNSNTVPHATRHAHDHDDICAAPIEAHTASGPTMMVEGEHGTRPVAERKSALRFKRLRKELSPPGPWLFAGMQAVLYLVMVLAGWNDASQGPLLPRLQSIYNVDYLVISIIWICNFVGFMAAGTSNVFLTDRFGFGIAAPFGAGCQCLAYCLLLWGPPYPLFLIAYIFNGFGLGLQDAQVNSITSRLPNANTKMFLLHAFYGLGATISPLVATEFVKREPNRVYLYFAVSLGLGITTVVALLSVFQLRTEDQVVGKREPAARPAETEASNDKDVTAASEPLDEVEKEEEEGSGNKLKRIWKTPAVHFMAFYLAIYVGVEVTLGGWITSFLLDERGGDDNAGYVTTGYFAGLTVGRVILIPVTTWIGRHNAIYVYTIGCIILEIIIWTVHDLIANAVLYSIVGVLLGPQYPIVMMVVLETLPPELQAGTIGWCAALGQAGSAIMPFITGGISNKYGVWILQPLIISFMAASLILWAMVPRPKGWIA